MKKILFLSMLATLVGFTSCSNSDDTSGINPNSEPTTFILAMEDAVGSPQARSVRATPTRYVMEVWSEDGTTAENVFKGGTKNHAEITTGNTFTITLDKTKAYTCLFWADDNATTYDATSLKAISIKADKEVTEAYHGKVAVAKGKNLTVAVTLKRAVAKVTLEEVAAIEVGKTLTATYKQLPQFNVLESKAIGTMKEKTYTVTTVADKLTGKFAEFYLLGTIDQSPIDFSFIYNGEPAKVVTNVPIQQNYITNIKGQYSSLINFAFNISADDAWGTPDLEAEALSPNTVKNTTKGKLKETVEAVKLESSEELIILGPINTADLAYLNGLKTLKVLNLSGATLWGRQH